MKTLRTAFLALFLVGLVAAPPAQAQSPWDVGPLLGVNLDNDELLLGAVARIRAGSAPITLNPGFEFYPGIDDVGTLSRSLFVLNLDVQYQLEAETVEPYVGGGISWARASTEGSDAQSDVGLNVKGGLMFNQAGAGTPYVEAVLNFADGTEALIFKAGYLFTIGG
jgi:hypothetical protein